MSIEREYVTKMRDLLTEYLDKTGMSVIEGDTVVKVPQTIANKIFRGSVVVEAPDVTFENCRMEGTNKDQNLLKTGLRTKLFNVDIFGSPHGQWRGIWGDSAGVRLINTNVRDIWSPDSPNTQAFGAWNGCKDLLIDGGIYESCGINILFGGDHCDSVDNIPQDITIQNATLIKDLKWREKLKGETAKNLFEIKNAKKVKLSNVKMKYSWRDGQDGYAILLTVRQTPHPFCVIEDVLIEDCDIESVGGFCQILGRDDENAQPDDGILKRVTIRGNEVRDISNERWADWQNGLQFMINSGSEKLTIEENTFKGDTIHSIIYFVNPAYKNKNFVFKKNSVIHGTYGIHGVDVPPGETALDFYAPGHVYEGNVVEP